MGKNGHSPQPPAPSVTPGPATVLVLGMGDNRQAVLNLPIPVTPENMLALIHGLTGFYLELAAQSRNNEPAPEPSGLHIARQLPTP